MNRGMFHPSKGLDGDVIGQIESFHCVAECRDRLSVEETPRGGRQMTINPLQVARSGAFASLCFPSTWSPGVYLRSSIRQELGGG